jgi:energy-coupling factor transport system substrate-specific component
VLAVASVAGMMMLVWPLLVRQPTGGQVGPPFVFLALLPVVIVVVLAEVSEGGLDPRVLAVLGVLSAVNAVLRGLSPGTAGVELVFFLLILAGRVFGPGFGFVLGCTSLFASALLTGGVGPWLPFQMLCSAWVGMGAGLLPRRVIGRAEISMLAAYGVVAAYAFGILLNLSSWPFVLGVAAPGHTGLAFVPGDPLSANLHRFLIYTLVTSTGSFDTGRAITNAVAIVLLGPAVLTTRRRAVRPTGAPAHLAGRGPGGKRVATHRGASVACARRRPSGPARGEGRSRCPLRSPASGTRPVPRSEEPLVRSAVLPARLGRRGASPARRERTAGRLADPAPHPHPAEPFRLLPRRATAS